MRKSGVGGSGPDSPSAARPHDDSFVPDLGWSSWARGQRGQPGHFKSPRPAEQCAPLPTPQSRGSPSPAGARSLSVRGVCLARPTRGQPLSAQALREQEAAQDATRFAQLPAAVPLRTVRSASGM